MRLPRFTLSKRKLVVAAVCAVVVLVAALAVGPIVRGRVAAEAARRHLDVVVQSVRLGWFAVRLRGVAVKPSGVEGVTADLDDVTVRLSAGLHVQAVEAQGGAVVLRGSVPELRDRLRAWRGERPEGSTEGAAPTPISASGLAVRWFDGDADVPRIAVTDAGFRRDAEGTRLSAGSFAGHSDAAILEMTGAAVDLGPDGALRLAHATSALVEWDPRDARRVPGASAGAPDARPPAPPSSAPSSPSPVAVAMRGPAPHARPGNTVPPRPADPSTPLVDLPDLHALRARAATVASLLSERVPPGAAASIDAMTWKIGQAEDRVALTIGPGPVSLDHTPERFELRFSTDPHAPGTALAVRAVLPTGEQDVSATLEGGPVSLSLLGVHDGAFGLVDVARATVTGTARIALAGDGTGLTVDAKLGTRALSLHQPRLAPEVVRGIDLDVRLRGTVDDAGAARLDDLALTLGTLHVAASGTLDQKPDHVSASLRFDLPSAPCQSLLESVPTALLPELQGTRMKGTFGARGRFAFDTRALDDLELEYDVQDDCRMEAVPMALARERFKGPFDHRIYLPDGTTSTQVTGPSTPSWTPLGAISPYMQVAVLTTEDGGFLHHHGFNRPSIRASLVANLKARRFVRGASTITMQLAKNLFLSRDKTLARKLEEVVLTDYLEQTFTKDEMLELYFNVIEFGPAVYGITNASEYYFGRSPNELNLAECLFLASLLPAPLRFGGMRDAAQPPESWMGMLHKLMQIEAKRGLITDAEMTEGQSEAIAFWHGGMRPPPRPPVKVRSRLEGEGEEGGAAVPGVNGVPQEDGF